MESVEIDGRYANPHDPKQIGLGTHIQQHARINQTRQATERAELEEERSRHKPAKFQADDQDQAKPFVPVGMGGPGGRGRGGRGGRDERS